MFWQAAFVILTAIPVWTFNSATFPSSLSALGTSNANSCVRSFVIRHRSNSIFMMTDDARASKGFGTPKVKKASTKTKSRTSPPAKESVPRSDDFLELVNQVTLKKRSPKEPSPRSMGGDSISNSFPEDKKTQFNSANVGKGSNLDSANANNVDEQSKAISAALFGQPLRPSNEEDKNALSGVNPKTDEKSKAISAALYGQPLRLNHGSAALFGQPLRLNYEGDTNALNGVKPIASSSTLVGQQLASDNKKDDDSLPKENYIFAEQLRPEASLDSSKTIAAQQFHQALRIEAKQDKVQTLLAEAFHRALSAEASHERARALDADRFHRSLLQESKADRQRAQVAQQLHRELQLEAQTDRRRAQTADRLHAALRQAARDRRPPTDPAESFNPLFAAAPTKPRKAPLAAPESAKAPAPAVRGEADPQQPVVLASPAVVVAAPSSAPARGSSAGQDLPLRIGAVMLGGRAGPAPAASSAASAPAVQDLEPVLVVAPARPRKVAAPVPLAKPLEVEAPPTEAPAQPVEAVARAAQTPPPSAPAEAVAAGTTLQVGTVRLLDDGTPAVPRETEALRSTVQLAGELVSAAFGWAAGLLARAVAPPDPAPPATPADDDDDAPLLRFGPPEFADWDRPGDGGPAPPLGQAVEAARCSAGPGGGRLWRFEPGDAVAVLRSDGSLRAARYLGRLPRADAAGRPCDAEVVQVAEAAGPGQPAQERHYTDTRDLFRIAGVARTPAEAAAAAASDRR